MNELTEYLDSLCRHGGVEAIALATEDGTLVAGAGKGDVEYMGIIGATSRRTRLQTDGRELQVKWLEVNGINMCLTMAGQPPVDAVAGIQRLLKS
ncbi:MAG: hypothetical protein IPJ65_42510 [Archangiaceae bacterium]|nr:hypothetical protein [Archangiaceae bacterium]